jgi:hypothetical protein
MNVIELEINENQYEKEQMAAKLTRRKRTKKHAPKTQRVNFQLYYRHTGRQQGMIRWKNDGGGGT